MNRWNGKVAVVTGASAGIGSATCLALANAGMQVVGLARRAHLVNKLQSSVTGEGKILSRECDVSKSDDISATFKWIESEVGPIHVLVNNAGMLCDGQITDTGDKLLSEDELMLTLDVNVKGPIMCTKLAVNCMRRHGIDGHIITVNSIAGHYVPFSSYFNVYPASKHAVTAFHASLATELAHFNSKIKTTSLSPGLVATDLAGPIIDGIRPALAPKDIADAVIYILSTPAHVNISELTITPVAELRA